MVGANMPLPSGFNGRSGCKDSTVNPKTNINVLNSSMETAYCRQFCGPVSTRRSIQLNHRAAR